MAAPVPARLSTLAGPVHPIRITGHAYRPANGSRARIQGLLRVVNPRFHHTRAW